LGDGGALLFSDDGTAAARWDPATDAWRTVTGLNARRSGFAAVPLPDGRVLVAGGVDDRDEHHWRAYSSAYVYDPATSDGTWTKVGLMGSARMDPVAALLPDGRVLVAGGSYIDGDPYPEYGGGSVTLAAYRPESPSTDLDGPQRFDDVSMPPIRDVDLATAEIFDPTTGRWSPTGSMRFAGGGSAVALTDGRVLVADPEHSQVYDPATGRFTLVGGFPPIDRAALAADGVEVPDCPCYPHLSRLVGLPGGDALAVAVSDYWKHAAQVYRQLRFHGDTGRWTQVGAAWAWSDDHAARGPRLTPGTNMSGALVAGLEDGRVLVAGGSSGDEVGRWRFIRAARLFDAASSAWSLTAPLPLDVRWEGGAAVRLSDGSVLCVVVTDWIADSLIAFRYVHAP
jgi:hypothetical protein